MPFSIDERDWPMVMLTITGSVTHAEEDDFANRSCALPSRGERYSAVVNLLDADTPTSRFIRTQASAQKRSEDALRTHCAGIAFVIGSPMLRGALRAILYLQPLPCPQIVVGTVDEARTWAQNAFSGATSATKS
ncbi:MAG: hypothetical protein AAGA54_22895 [Myxococcota bacterium]